MQGFQKQPQQKFNLAIQYWEVYSVAFSWKIDVRKNQISIVQVKEENITAILRRASTK